MAGVPTTAGSRAVEQSAAPATADAACLAGARAAGARIVGKTNLHELAMLPLGTNPWFGTPVNPLDPALIPGGSSSGSAVAVATGEADVALGSDTGGSIRIPAACCGITGLKTTLRPGAAGRRLAAGAKPGHRRPDGRHRGRARDRGMAAAGARVHSRRGAGPADRPAADDRAARDRAGRGRRRSRRPSSRS